MQDNSDKRVHEKERGSESGLTDFRPLALAWELGYTIAIPLVIFALAGRFVDKYFNSSPLWLLIGIVVSIVFTSFLLVRKMKSFF